MAKLAEVAAPIALKIVIFRARKVLEPKIAKSLSKVKIVGMEGSTSNSAEVVSWDDMVAAIAASEIVTKVEEVKIAFENNSIDGIVDTLEEVLKDQFQTGPLVKKMVFAMLRPEAEPSVKEHGVTWRECTEVMEQISLDDMKKYAVEYAETGELEPIMVKLAEIAGPIALKIAIFNARKVFEPRIKTWCEKVKMQGFNSSFAGVDVKWDDIVSVIVASGIEAEVKNALTKDLNGNGIVDILEKALKDYTALLLNKMLFAAVRPKAEPRLKQYEITWGDFTEAT